MILIVSLTMEKPSLHEYEFVRPVENGVRLAGADHTTVHFSSLTPERIEAADGVILCGTALKDNAALVNVPRFGWVREFDRPLLGICMGSHIICLSHGGDLVEGLEIGHVKLHLEPGVEDPLVGEMDGAEVYGLHGFAPVLPEGFAVLARSDEHIQVFRKEGAQVYGILFHPEVRHGGIIKHFCHLTG